VKAQAEATKAQADVITAQHRLQEAAVKASTPPQIVQ
jgi:hypothetical protein